MVIWRWCSLSFLAFLIFSSMPMISSVALRGAQAADRLHYDALPMAARPVSHLIYPVVHPPNASDIESNAVSTPTESLDYFDGKFYVNMSQSSTSSPVSLVTTAVNATSAVDFIVHPIYSMGLATIEVGGTQKLLNARGQTSFTGSILANSTMDLRFNITAISETYADLSVNATGTATIGQSQRTLNQLYILTVNTTGWLSLTHSFSAFDPYSGNSTRIPTVFLPQISKVTLESSPMVISCVAMGNGVCIDGFLFYAWGGMMHPLRQVTVTLRDDHYCVVNCFQMQTTTDDSGYYFFDATKMPNPFSPHLYAEAYSKFATVKPDCILQNCGYDVDLGQVANAVPNPSDIHLNPALPQGYNEFALAYDAVYTAYLKLGSYGFDQWWSQQVTWPTGNWPNANWNGFNSFINLPASANCLKPNCLYARGIYHEYGHAVQQRLYGGYVPSCCGGMMHNDATEFDGGFALSEGWANFINSLVAGNSVQRSGDDMETDLCIAKDGVTPTPCYNVFTPGDRDGNRNEYSVAAIFWDMLDNTPAESYPCPGDVPPPKGYPCGGSDRLHFATLVFITGPGGNVGAHQGIFPDDKPGDMLAFLADFFNDQVAPFDNNSLCITYSAYGIDPPQCKGVSAPTFPSLVSLIFTIGSAVVLRRAQKSRFKL